MRKKFLYGFLFFTVLIGCEDPDELSTGVLPASDQFGLYTATLSPKVYSVLEDSLVGSYNTSSLFLGSINDPEIGSTYASFYIQVRLGELLSNGFGITNPDSVMLTFGYNDIYGDTTVAHHISVYKLDETLSTNDTLYTNKTLAIGNIIGSAVIIPNRSDSIQFGVQKEPAQFVMRLNDDFGSELMTKLNTEPNITIDNFLGFLRGIYIRDSVDFPGSVITFDPSSAYNRITVFYSDSLQYSFILNQTSARLNHFHHSYLPNVTDTVTPANTLFVQSMAGLKAKLQLTGLQDLVAGRTIAINKAELIVKVKDNSTLNGLNSHTRLFAVTVDSLGVNRFIKDYEESFAFVDGNVSEGEYKFNISRHLQRILNGDIKDNDIYLVADGGLVNSRRTLLKGTGEVQLNITYTVKN